jgi:uncharacterized protein (UPF0371 family)
MKIGFDNEKYLRMQSSRIRERIGEFGDKLYLEFGGKLFDDYHASRVLPGFMPDSKLRMLLQLKDQAEIIVAISAGAIASNKIRGDLGITYDDDALRLIDVFRSFGLYVGGVAITQYTGETAADEFRKRLDDICVPSYLLYKIEGYPGNIEHIVSDEGYGKNEYIKTTRPLVIVTAPGPGSGKMATCLSQLYHENKRGVLAGYAKFETFPVWNLPLNHPVNIAYEAATADLNDVNMIDPFHLEAYGQTSINYNRDVEIYPVLKAMFKKIYGSCHYKSPTDMGVNMVGYCISDDALCQEAGKTEIIRRYYTELCNIKKGTGSRDALYKIQLLMKQVGIAPEDRKVALYALEVEATTQSPAVAVRLDDGTLIDGKTSDLLNPAAAVILNTLKELAGIPHKTMLISPEALQPITHLKKDYLGSQNPRLHSDEVLVALSISANTDANAKAALEQLPNLRGLDGHSTVMLSSADEKIFRRLGMYITCEPKNQINH